MPSVKWNLWRHKENGTFTCEIYGRFPEMFEYLPTTYTFDAVLKYEDYYRGRSACGTYWTDMTTGNRYSMGMTDMDAMLKSGDIVNRTIAGTWGFVKRGTLFGIVYKGKQSSNGNS